MKGKLFVSLSVLFVCFFSLVFSGCSDDSKDVEKYPLSIPDMRDGKLRLEYPLPTSFTVSEIYGGTKPYKVSCESDILQVGIYDKAPGLLTCKTLGVGEATVIVTDATGSMLKIPIEIGYSDLKLTIASREVLVAGDGLTIGQTKELKEKALEYLLVEDDGFYRMEYITEKSGNVFALKKPIHSFLYQGTFEVVNENEDEPFLSEYIFTFGDESYPVKMAISNPESRYDLDTTSIYVIYQDMTEAFKEEYPELEKLTVVLTLGYFFK